MKTVSLVFVISLFINVVFGEEVSVMEGDSVTLHTDITETQADDLILVWTVGDEKTIIVNINRDAKDISVFDNVLDGRFRNRLKLDNQTGDLTITNITTQHSGVYQVEITVGSKNIQKSFNVKGMSYPESDQLKSVSVKDGDFVTLHTDDRDIKKYDEILWRFQGSRIAHFKSASEISEDERFRGKLQLDVQTRSLKIKNIRTGLSGLYEVDLTSSSSSYTIHQTFTVTVSGEVKSVSAMKGDPLIIYTDVPDIETYDRILLVFGCDDMIADVNRHFPNKQFTLEGEYRDRLKLNDQTGDLTITKIKIEDAGDYELKMISRRRTIQRRFRVNVSEPGLSPGAVAGLSVFFLLFIAAAAAVGVIFYRRKIAELLDETKILRVYEGESVDLETEVTDIKKDEKIEWRFEKTLIAEINPANNIFSSSDKGLFRDKLKLNHQTGDLTIKDITWLLTGDYKLKIIRDGKTSYKRFTVMFMDETKILVVFEGKSADLKTDLTDIKRDDVIEWRFKETLIAKINPANNIFNKYDGDYGEFRDKLKLDHQTGDLTINDSTWLNNGEYTLKIIRGGEAIDRRFLVSITREKEELTVFEGESVNLKTKFTDIKRVNLIEWTYRSEDRIIAKINPANNICSTYDGDDGKFRDRLHLDPQTGNLTIDDITWEHRGYYTLKIITERETLYRKFLFTVKLITQFVFEGESVHLKTKVKDIKRDDLIEWRFGETLIAKINPANNIFKTYDDDDLFRDKLKLNPQTGDLMINGTTLKHGGGYYLKIIRDGKTSYKGFSVCLYVLMLVVDKGGSINLETLRDIQKEDVITWRFGDKGPLIAEINRAKNIISTYDGDDNIFRGKLELNPENGNLHISDFREEHDGTYRLDIIRGEKPFFKSIIVSLYDETEEEVYMTEGSSVDLKTDLDDIKRDDEIEWRFGETLIAKINPYNNIFSTSDHDLFRDKLTLNPQAGDLNINDIRKKHEGDYEVKIIRDGRVSCRRFIISREDPGRKKRDPVRRRTRYPVEKKGGDSEEKKGGDSEEKKGGDSEEQKGDFMEIEMLLPESISIGEDSAWNSDLAEILGNCVLLEHVDGDTGVLILTTSDSQPFP